MTRLSRPNSPGLWEQSDGQMVVVYQIKGFGLFFAPYPCGPDVDSLSLKRIKHLPQGSFTLVRGHLNNIQHKQP